MDANIPTVFFFFFAEYSYRQSFFILVDNPYLEVQAGGILSESTYWINQLQEDLNELHLRIYSSRKRMLPIILSGLDFHVISLWH